MSTANGESRGLTAWEKAALVAGAAGMGWLIYRSVIGHASAPPPAPSPPGMISIAPFAGLLLCIAVLPLLPATAHWWEHNRNRLVVSLSFAAATLTYYALTFNATKVLHVLEHAVVAEYLPFIVLLFSLYVISGGICLRGDLPAHPLTNTAFLAVGSLAASFVGTTGASMLLIRPLLQTNSERRHVVHTVVFFIFLVSNVGGCLLPIGDPPLFLGYLKGVPFLWTLTLWKEWAAMSAVLLVVYYVWDTLAYRHEAPADIVHDEVERAPLSLEGKLNFVWLAGVVLCVGVIKPGEVLPGTTWRAFPFLRELLMLGLTGLSLAFTPGTARAGNRFSYTAILEVAALFIGIFICMQAPIEILRASGAAMAGLLSSPARFFWATGVLSSFLDNAPTYVVFLETAVSMTPQGAAGTLALFDGALVTEPELIAISLGAVFMGANTYIGNGPNFMVKTIAEQAGVRMPSFFGYMAYSGGILLPLFAALTFLFLA